MSFFPEKISNMLSFFLDARGSLPICVIFFSGQYAKGADHITSGGGSGATLSALGASGRSFIGGAEQAGERVERPRAPLAQAVAYFIGYRVSRGGSRATANTLGLRLLLLGASNRKCPLTQAVALCI